jgi:WD40 repeat protein
MNHFTLSHSSFSDKYYGICGKRTDEVVDWDIHKIVVAHQSGQNSIWDLRKMSKPVDVLDLHQEDCRSVEYDPSCRYLATASFDCTIKIWDSHKDEICHIFGKNL